MEIRSDAREYDFEDVSEADFFFTILGGQLTSFMAWSCRLAIRLNGS